MGVSQAPAIAQERMKKTLKNIDDLEVYINDIGLFCKEWGSHVEALDQVCPQL
jgi:hypothetical protein